MTLRAVIAKLTALRPPPPSSPTLPAYWPGHTPSHPPSGLTLVERRAAGLQERAAPRYRGLGWCLRCTRPWGAVAEHVTVFNDHQGTFPLCTDCWTELAVPPARLPYYSAQHVWGAQWCRTPDEWAQYEAQWPQIHAAVLAGR